MSFPNYSSLFTLGLANKKPSTSRRHSLKSFLKLDTRIERADAPPLPSLPIITPVTPLTSTHTIAPLNSNSKVVPLVCRRSRESLRTIPSPKPVPAGRSLPSPPLLTLPALSHSTTPSPSSATSTLPPITPPAHSTQSLRAPSPIASVSTLASASTSTSASSASIITSKPAPARKSSTALGLHLNFDGLNMGMAAGPSTVLSHLASPAETASVAASSIASPRRRHVSRAGALAVLEGRTASRNPARAKNFMSMSDDEDEHDELASFSPISPGVSYMLPSLASKSAKATKSAPGSPSEHGVGIYRRSLMGRSRAASLASSFPGLARNFLDFGGGSSVLSEEGDDVFAVAPQSFSSFMDVSA